MAKTPPSLLRRFARLLGSETCFRLIIGLLVVEAAWIALSGRYPMAFDEDFHLGIIRLYAHHLSPFWGNQTPGGGTFGAVARDPSYLYQWLMSFPYRLITVFTHDQTTQVLWLRAISIGLFSSGVVLYRRLLLKAQTSKAMVHCCLLVFVLLPVTPLLAAQINYDNLLFPLVAASMLLALSFDEQLVKRRQLGLKQLLQLLILCLLASLVKYAFLPIFAALVGFVAVRLWQHRRLLPTPWFGLVPAWRRLGSWSRAALIVGLVLAAGLFGERYGVNLIRYHTPIPDCSDVLTIKQCSQYGPWIRNYNDEINKVDNDILPGSLPTFTADWLYGMWLRTFFAVDGPGTNFQTRGPLLLPGLSTIIFAVVGALAVLAAAGRLWRKHNTPIFWLFVVVVISYVGALWLDDYQAFLQTGQPVAINGRYLLQVLLPVFLIVAVAMSELLKRRPALKLTVASVAILCLAWGGGALTYILRSNDAWYWPTPAVQDANHAVQRVLGPLTPGYDKTTLFMSQSLD
jgi:hypothetical protein